MPDVKTLKPGDKIRLLRVPEGDLKQREREKDMKKDEGWMCTATTIEEVIRENPVVTIQFIDEYGAPWFFHRNHSIAVYSDESWAHFRS